MLVSLLSQYNIRRSVTDYGARYQGSNSWHLIAHHGFRGILIDRNHESCRELRERLPKAHVFAETITPDNCNEFVNFETGILCIDIDGNDYHIWKAIRSKPDVVCIEFGRRRMIEKFNGPQDKWIPDYDPESRKRHDGACEEALIELGIEKGYKLYATVNVNLIFVSLQTTTKTARIPPVKG